MLKRSLLFLASVATLLVSIMVTIPAQAQSATGEIRGVVTDPSGAVISSANIVLASSDGVTTTAASGRDGGFHFASVKPGTYTLVIEAKGFATATLDSIEVEAGKLVQQSVKMELPVEQQQVEVKEDSIGVSTSADNNASATIIKGKDLDALSDDPDELQSELTALAGPAAGPNGAQIYIDGFTGGQLPPKSSIREIRINQNPFSAQYDKLGYGRIEILTKPGTDKLHGNLMIMGNDSVFNSLNPFVTDEPPYYTTFMNGSIGGALGKKASWFGSVFNRNNASNSIINAEILDANSNVTNYSAAVANPQSRLDISPRFDFQLSDRNTLTVRYMFDRQKQTNGVNWTKYDSELVIRYESCQMT